MAKLLGIAAFTFATCSGVDYNPRPDTYLSVEGAHYVDGKVPVPNGGPALIAFTSTHPQVVAGTDRETIRGVLPAHSTAAVLSLAADPGYWVIKAAPPLSDQPQYPIFEAVLGFADDMPSGPFEIIALAVDPMGHYGPPYALPLVLNQQEIEGDLVFALTWDSASDLDLHVVDPQGIEIWSGNPNSFKNPPPGTLPGDPEAWRQGGILEGDVNSGCRIAGRRQERIVWRATPPPGRYVVRVATFALCEHVTANWHIDVIHHGQSIAQARGIAGLGDSVATHGLGAGVTALEVEIP